MGDNKKDGTVPYRYRRIIPRFCFLVGVPLTVHATPADQTRVYNCTSMHMRDIHQHFFAPAVWVELIIPYVRTSYCTYSTRRPLHGRLTDGNRKLCQKVNQLHQSWFRFRDFILSKSKSKPNYEVPVSWCLQIIEYEGFHYGKHTSAMKKYSKLEARYFK